MGLSLARDPALYGLTGRPSLDPDVFFKLLLVGRLENIISDQRLVEQCALRLDILYFLGYEVDENLPWHSTISGTRQRYLTAHFERLFDWVFAQCVAIQLEAYVSPFPALEAAYSHPDDWRSSPAKPLR
ncbi:MAG: transposase [Janthinobacterium lividum]